MIGKVSRLLQHNKGITLLELSVVLAVLLIVSGGVMIGFRQADRRALHHASLQLQADLRYTQRRAIMEGRPFGIVFDVTNNQYRIVSERPARTLRTEAIPNGVLLSETSAPRLMFHPRGTPTAGFRITLAYKGNTQRITASVAGGRIRVFDINELDYE